MHSRPIIGRGPFVMFRCLVVSREVRIMARKTSSPKTRIDVWCDETQLAQIKRNADASRLPVSDFLRKLGNGYKPKSIFDRETIRELARLSADQDRLSDQLERWLLVKKKEDTPVNDGRAFLNQIERLQAEIADLVMEAAQRL